MAPEPSHMALDWLLVVACCFSVILAIVYLFYSNRILAFLLGYLLHLSWWNEESDRAWVSLESFQVSLLAGRIMIKDLRYYSGNQSFRAIKCRVTWRYWLWRTRDDFTDHVGEEENKGNSKTSTLPCRLHIALEGVEWRFFNRTAAHNNILSRMQRHSNHNTAVPNGRSSTTSGQSQDFTAFTSEGGDALPGKINSADRHPPSASGNARHSRLTMFGTTLSGWFADIKPDFHEILPIDVSAVRGAIVWGNASTPSLLVARFSQAQGLYSVVSSKSLHDKYKTMIDVKFQNVKCDMQRNDKYSGSLVQHGDIVCQHLVPDPIASQLSFSSFTRLWTDQKRSETTRETDDIHARTEADHEQVQSDYAVVETIFETPQLEISYYWDEPGTVPVDSEASFGGLDSHDVGNGGLAPQYGIDIVVHGGITRYGPWADRQRVELQRVFFPPSYQNIQPTPTLKPGDTRMYTALKIFVELRDTITFHTPFRESSKDWQFDEAKFPGSTRKRREGGWLEVHAGGNSTINYVLPWVATADGYNTLLELHLNQVKALSSVNDIQLLRAESSRVLCELPTPRRWNDSRQWTFDVSFRAPTIHLIRDHITLLTDLGKDWSTGPPSDFDRWIPMRYLVSVSLQDFEVNMYLNDHNIITHPHARDANTLLTLRGKMLRNAVEMPFTVFRPQYIKIPFWIEVPGVKLSLTLPKWNTHSILASSRTTDFGYLGFLRVDSSFLYYSKTRPEYIDQLKLDILARDMVLISFGWVIRHLMNVRDNYFGNFTHFSTLREYVTKRDRNVPVGDPVEWKWRKGKSNVFEVSLGVRVERSVIVFPAGFPGYEFSLDQSPRAGRRPGTEPIGLGTSVIVLHPELQLLLRTHDYSMEMSLNISPMTISVVEDLVHNLLHDSYGKLGRQKLQIDGVNILAHRLFGPQPRTSTYLCLWEFQIGAVAGIVSMMELRGLSAALTSFRVNFIDALNAPASEFAIPSEPDVTFFKLNLKSLDIALVVCQASLQLCFPHGIKFDYNDLAGNSYKKVTEIRVSQAVIRALLRLGRRPESWLEAGSIIFDMGIDIYSSPQGWSKVAKGQSNFVAIQDAPTRRAWYLYENASRRPMLSVPPAYHASMFLPRPTFPNPCLHEKTNNTSGTGKSRKSRRGYLNVWTSNAVDSDEDEHISEADRDARLANSRPATPLMFGKDYDDRSMSSSDESDNDITSDVPDSDSDEQNEPNAGDGRASSPLLSHYKNIVRRFETQFDDTSMFWAPSVFNLVRDITLPVDDLPCEITPSAAFNGDQFRLHQATNASLNSFVKLIQCSHIDVLVTPLCTHVIEKISNEILNLSTSMELVVDSLTKEYLTDALKETALCPSQQVLDVGVSALRLRILQNLVGVDEPITPASPATPFHVQGTSRIISDMVLSLHDLTACFSDITDPLHTISNRQTTFRGSLSRLKGHLDTFAFHPLSQMNRTPKSSRQCVFEMNKSKTVCNSDNLHITLGDTHVQILGNASPEILAVTLDSFVLFIRETTTHASRTNQFKAMRQLWIRDILQSCRGTPIEDPLTLIQPSILIQRGCPLRIRHDATWKLFMYLRYCLRFRTVSHKEKPAMVSSPPDSSFTSVKMDDILDILYEKLASWSFELSRQEVALLPFIRYCFVPTVHPSTEKSRNPYTRLPVLSFHSGTFMFSIFECPSPFDGALGNTFSLGPFQLVYRYRKQALMMPPVRMSGVPFLELSPTHHHVLSITIKDARYSIHPSFFVFLQHLLRLRGKLASTKVTAASSSSDSSQRSDNYWECFVDIKHISIQAAVEGMVLAIGLSNVNLATTVLYATPIPRSQSRLRRFVSGNSLIKSSQLYTHVRQAHDRAEPFSSNGRDILTSFASSSLIIDISYQMTREHSPVIHSLLTMDSLMLNVPRSALLTYRLIEEWRIQYLPNIHVMAKELFAELENRQSLQSPSHRAQAAGRTSFPIIEFQTSIKRVGMSLQVMHGTWFSWDVHDIVGFLRSVVASTRIPRFAFGVQLASQLIRIGEKPSETMEKTAKTIKLPLRAFRASGNYDGFQLRSHVIIDHISLPLKPNYMDDILVVQQNLGTHFYDVLELISEGRKNRFGPKKPAILSVRYNVAFMLQGFRIGIEAPTTTLALTSGQMTGTSRNEAGSAWDFAVSNLALTLSHHSADTWPRSEFDRSLISAYMALDVKASGLPVTSTGGQVSRVLRLQVSRMHAVMFPNSIGELGDLIDHVQAEKHLRHEQRALELEEIKRKTKRVMRAFEVPKATTSPKRSPSHLDNLTFLIDVADIGIAFPLALKNEIEVDSIGSVPAFLMSIKTAAFSVKRFESGHASMNRLSFQFVRRFDQSNPDQFSGDQHHSRNKLLYPGMKADFRTGSSSLVRQWHISAFVDGFVLDLDPTVVDSVFGLVDVYRKGRERIARLSVGPQTTKSVADDTAAAVEASYLAVRTSNILITLVFQTGKLHLRGIQPDLSQSHLALDAGCDVPDVVDFPTITVWGDYRATPAASKVLSSQDQEPSVLIFESQVHATTNRIQPSIFLFLLGIAERVENRFRLPDVGPPSLKLAVSTSHEASSRDTKEFLAPGVFNGIQLSFSLRIDSSRLELDCAHDLGVVAALHWESGGFLMTISPRAQVAHFAGSVTGLEIDLRHLKHQAGTVQTAKVDARNLAFSVSYSQTDDIQGVRTHSVSVVVDTEFGAAVKLDRLQDILIFKAIYIDRLPGTVPQPSTKSTPVLAKSSQGIPGLTMLVLVRARHVKLFVDLGHNVAAAVVNLESLVLRSRIAGSVTDLSVSIASTSLDLEEDRPLGGYLRLPDFSFTTVRRSDVQLGMKDGVFRMLDVTLESGALDIVLQSEKRTLLQYHAQPFEIRIADDWSAIDWNLLPEERTLLLDFSVVGKDVLAIANLQSVPRIINLLSKLRSDLNSQQVDARNALATSSIAQLPKPGSALSEVADAMIRSARSQFNDGPAFSYIILQRMKLRLSSLRLALFKSPSDSEMALFQGRDVHAELERTLHSFETPPTRRLKLAFSSLYLSKYSSLKYRSAGDELMAVPWLEHLLQGASESAIARVPAMTLEMKSDVEYEGRQEILEYDLVATADERAQPSRSIYVSLNLSLYIWAGALVKGLGLEIDKALVSSGFNKPAVRAIGGAIASPPQIPTGASHGEGKTKAGETTLLSPHPPRPPLTTSMTTSPHETDAPLPRIYRARSETSIDYGTIEQLGEATPDAKAPWLGLKETVPPRVHEYATLPMEVLMKMLLEVYSKQLKMAAKRKPETDFSDNTTGDIDVGNENQG